MHRTSDHARLAVEGAGEVMEMQWLPGTRLLATYRREWLLKDVVAGVVLTTLLVPQGMAYAELAGLPPINGLYTTILCLLAYAVFGPSRILVLGPDSSLGPMIAATILPLVAAGGDPVRAIALSSMLAIMVAAIMILASVREAGLHRRPAVEAEHDRLHERARPHDPRGAAPEAVRVRRQRGRPASRDRRVRPGAGRR